MRLAAPAAGLPQRLVARVSALPPRRQEWIQDGALGVALAAVNVFSCCRTGPSCIRCG